MKKMMKYTLIVFGVAFVIVAVLVLRPVPIVSEDKAITEKGIVTNIYEGGTNDIVFRLENNKRKCYINRGLEEGLELNNLREKLVGNQIVLKYPKYWTPLDWNDKIKHISKVEFNDEILFNELKNQF